MPNPSIQFALPRRSRRWLLLFSPFILLIALYTAFEWFVDPFPNSVWALRVLNTKYLVHVRADLTIDGGPLVMERTFRCFDPVDHYFLARNFFGSSFRSNGQAGDTIAATTQNGRLFAMTGLNVCELVANRAGVMTHEATPEKLMENGPLLLSQKEFETPVVFEIFGGRAAEQVDAYVAREEIMAGYHGVRLNEMLVETILNPQSPWDFSKDWNGYDWFGTTSWVRRFIVGRTRPYTAAYLVPVEKDRWSNLAHLVPSQRSAMFLNNSVRLENIEDVQKLSSITVDRLIKGTDNLGYGLFFGFAFEGVVNPIDSLIPRPPWRPELTPMYKYFNWAQRVIIPCVGNTDRSVRICDPAKSGILSYQLDGTRKNRQLPYTYTLNSQTFLLDRPGSALWYRHSTGTAFVTGSSTYYMGDSQ